MNVIPAYNYSRAHTDNNNSDYGHRLNPNCDYRDQVHLGQATQAIKNEDRSILGSLLGKIWSIPTTIIGLIFGAIGLPFGAKLSIGNNAIQFENHPLMQDCGGMTLGNTIAYGSMTGPAYIGDHERQHTYQAEALGPLYIPAHLAEGAEATLRDGHWHGKHNYLEQGPMNVKDRKPW